MRLRFCASSFGLAVLTIGVASTPLGSSACGGDDTAGPTDASDSENHPASDAAPDATDSGGPGIHGTITVHAPDVGRVLLGDGSRFAEDVDANGVVTFTDPAIVGPQNVTLVLTPRERSMIIYTLVKVDVADVWVSASSVVPGPVAPRAVLKSNLTYPSDPAITRIDLTAIGDDDARGELNVPGAGPISVSVDAKSTAASCDLFGRGYTAGTTRLLRAGAARNIALPAAVPVDVTAPDLVLDHPFDQPIAITTTNGAAYGPDVAATISYFRKSDQVMKSDETFTGAAGKIQSIAMTAPFDTLGRVVRARVGDTTFALVDTPLAPNETTVTAAFAQPATVTSPPTADNGDGGAPATAFAPGSSLAVGGVDPAAQVTEVSMVTSRPASDAGTEFSFYWFVSLPKGETSFTFPELPAENPTRFFPSGMATVHVTTSAYKQSTLAEVYGADQSAVDTIARTRGLSQTTVTKYFTVK
jgi:hypothetical protein